VGKWFAAAGDFRFKTNKTHRIEFPEPVYAVSIMQTHEFNTAQNHEIQHCESSYNYQSLVMPSSVFDY